MLEDLSRDRQVAFDWLELPLGLNGLVLWRVRHVDVERGFRRDLLLLRVRGRAGE